MVAGYRELSYACYSAADSVAIDEFTSLQLPDIELQSQPRIAT